MIQFALCIFLRWVGEKPSTRLYMFFFVVGYHTLGIIPYMLFALSVRWLGINVHPRNLTHWYQKWWALELGTCIFAFRHGYVQGINSLDFRVCNPREEWKKTFSHPGTSALPTPWDDEGCECADGSYDSLKVVPETYLVDLNMVQFLVFRSWWFRNLAITTWDVSSSSYIMG